MAISHLLQGRSCSFIGRNAFQRRVVLFSSHTSSDTETEQRSNSKKTNMAKEQRAEAVESFVKKYMERNPGVFPKATLVQNEVGGSWYTVKDAIDRIKEKMGAPEPENDHDLIDSASASPPAASNSNLCDQPESGTNTDLAVIPQSTDENIRHTKITAPAESSLELVDYAACSEFSSLHDFSASCEFQAASLQSANSAISVSGSEKEASANIIPLVSRSKSEDTIDINAFSDSLPFGNGQMMQNEVHSHMCRSSGRDLLLDSAKLSDLEHGKVYNTRYKAQQENKELTCSLLNLCSSMTDKHALNRSSVSGLADLFKNNDDEAIAEFKNAQLLEGLQSSRFLSARERNSQVNQLASSYPFSSSKSHSNMQVTIPNKPVLAEYKSHPPEEETTISNGTQSIISEVEEPFATAEKKGSSGDTNTISNQASKVMNSRKSDMVFQSNIEHLEEYKEKDGAKSFEIKHLIDCIKKLPQRSNNESQENAPTSIYDGSSKGNLSGGPDLLAFQVVGKKGRKPLEGTVVREELEDDGQINILSANLNVEHDTESCPEFAIPDLVKSLITDIRESNDIRKLSKESEENVAMVKFLRTVVTESDLQKGFKDCGDISKVDISNVEGAYFQVAYVYFRTREGLRKALEKTDFRLKTSDPTVEATGLDKDMSNKISIPILIGDPSIPTALVKNPTRTVVIKKLTHDISSRHIEAALTFCGSNITGFFLGSSSSAAYVEFETEDGKEKALAKRYIDILGKRLVIYRIDIPRTTIVRISHHHSIKTDDVVKACHAVGKVRLVRCRLTGVVDVQFTLAEWPNMLKILNRLNAKKIDGRRLLAQPATIIPPQILCALWNQPEGRKYIKTMLQRLSHRVWESVPPIRDDLEIFYSEKL